MSVLHWLWRKFKFIFILLGLLLIGTVVFPKIENSFLTRSNIDEKNKTNFLVILIMTGPLNVERRNAMRETWLSSDNKPDIIHRRHFFVVGVKNLPAEKYHNLVLEKNHHNDLMFLEDLEDSYKHLTEKLGQMLEWLNQNVQFQYVLKVDDDTYVRLEKVMESLKKDPEKRDAKSLYWGYFYGKANVKHSGPWKETNWKLCDYYIPYARGGGYVMSSNLVKFIANNWQDFQQYLSEDVSLGAWLAPLKLTRVHDIRFDTEYKSRGCKNDFIVSHKQSIEEMREKHKNIKLNGKMCMKETSNFNGYIYNWNVAPSQCCVRSKNIP